MQLINIQILRLSTPSLSIKDALAGRVSLLLERIL